MAGMSVMYMRLLLHRARTSAIKKSCAFTIIFVFNEFLCYGLKNTLGMRYICGCVCSSHGIRFKADLIGQKDDLCTCYTDVGILTHFAGIISIEAQ